MVNFEKPDKTIEDLIKEQEDLEAERLRSEQQKQKAEKAKQDSAFEYQLGMEDYILMLRDECIARKEVVPEKLSKICSIIEEKRGCQQQLGDSLAEKAKLEERLHELRKIIEEHREQANYAQIQQKSAEAKRKFDLWSKSPSYHKRSPEGEARGTDLSNKYADAWQEVANVNLGCQEQLKEEGELEVALRKQEHYIEGYEIKLQKLEEDYKGCSYVFAETYKEAIENNGFNKEEAQIPLVAFLQTIIKGVRRKDVDMVYVKKLNLTDSKLESMMREQFADFTEIISAAVGLDKSKIDGYFAQIGFDKTIQQVFKLRDEKRSEEWHLSDLKDQNSTYYGGYSSEMYYSEDKIEELENQEQAVWKNIPAWSLREIAQGYKLDAQFDPN